MDAIIAVVVTLCGVAALLAAFIAGYRRGKSAGFQAGRKEAVTDLILAKDPEAWNSAHFLEVDEREKNAQRTTVVIKKSDVRDRSQDSTREVQARSLPTTSRMPKS